MPSGNGDERKLDKLWSFVQKKNQECSLWEALCRRTREIVARTIGDRSEEGAMGLREHVSEGRRQATHRDYWLAYAAASPARIHRFCGKEEGEIKHAERWFGTVRARLSRLVRRSLPFP